jgi:hypothetical protein
MFDTADWILMKSKRTGIALLLISMSSLLILGGCGAVHGDTNAEAPPEARVVPAVDISLFAVDHPEQFPLATAVEHAASSELVVTGTVTPDVGTRTGAFDFSGPTGSRPTRS